MKDEAISADPRNKAAVRRLIERLNAPAGILPFVGAGLSVPWGLPSWHSFLLQSARDAGVLRRVRSALDQKDYEAAADVLVNALGPARFDALISRKFGDDAVSIPNRSAAAYLPQLASGPVITTNFDHVLERIFRDAGRAFDLVVWGARASIIVDTLAEDFHLLIKFHGDVDDAEDRVLTRSEYNRHYGKEDLSGTEQHYPLVNLFIRLFRTRPVLFLGCSLLGDRYLDLMSRACEDSEVPEHFAIVGSEGSSNADKVRSHFLRKHGITPIWYPAGQHHLLTSFLATLAKGRRKRRANTSTVPAGLDGTARRLSLPAKVVQGRDLDLEERGRLRTEWQSLEDDRDKIEFLRRHGRFWYRAGFWPEYVELASEAIRAAKRLGARCDAAEFLNNLHLVHKRLSGHRHQSAAREALSEATRLLQSETLSGLHAVVTHNAGLAEFERGNYQQAAELYRQALTLARRAKDDRVAPILRNLGLALAKLGRGAVGLRVVRNALVHCQNSYEKGRCYLALSDIYDHLDRPAEMAEAAANGVKQFSLSRDLQALAQAKDDLGVALYHQGDYRGALTNYLGALWYEQQSDDRHGLFHTLINIAWLHFDSGEKVAIRRSMPERMHQAALHRSEDYYAQALGVARALGDRTAVARALAQKGLVTAVRGNVELGLGEIRKAESFARARKLTSLLALALNNRGRILERQSNSAGRSLRAYRAALQHALRAADVSLERTVRHNLDVALERRLGACPE
jgi:tetratricopeptide (TPR) repeat protein